MTSKVWSETEKEPVRPDFGGMAAAACTLVGVGSWKRQALEHRAAHGQAAIGVGLSQEQHKSMMLGINCDGGRNTGSYTR
jgi:hypothetical protein